MEYHWGILFENLKSSTKTLHIKSKTLDTTGMLLLNDFLEKLS